MKRVLYLTNIEVPYRVRFFNELAKYCDLTVLYETRTSEDRNTAWAKSEVSRYNAKYLREWKFGNIRLDVAGMLKEIAAGYDTVIVGCYNNPIQMLAILAMRLRKIPFMINLDGETFLDGNGIKSRLKRFFLTGAEKYLTAGEKSAESLKKHFPEAEVHPYYFSSLAEREIWEHQKKAGRVRNDTILVVGQYVAAKGLDILLDVAQMDQSLCYKLVGTGNRTGQFLKDNEGKIPKNVEIIPFLQKRELEEEYKHCAMLVLPSRQECWGLVINEAASFGMPIVSTWGSGAAVEFLADEYPQFLAKPGDAEDLLQAIHQCCNVGPEYGIYLMEKSGSYSVERSAREHII